MKCFEIIVLQLIVLSIINETKKSKEN